MSVLISECDQLISLHTKQTKSLSWEELQNIKDMHFPDKDFIEVYPKKREIINKANERHLIHIKGWQCPKMCDLERESKIIEL